MASGQKGTIYGTVYKSSGDVATAWHPRVVWSETYDVNNNKSTVTAELYYKLEYPSGVTSSPSSSTVSGKITINGSDSTYSKSFSVSNKQEFLAHTYSRDVTHNDDGSKSITISATGSAGNSLSRTDLSDTATLTTIARKSTVSSVRKQSDSDDYIFFGTNPRITWTPRSSSFKYYVSYSVGANTVSSGWITPNTTGSYTYSGLTIPRSWIGSIGGSNTSSNTLYITLYTYNGSTNIGSDTSGPYWVVVPYDVLPTASKPTVTGSDLFNNKYLQNKSSVTVSATGSGAHSSTIKKVEIYQNGNRVATRDSTSASYTGQLTSSGNISFTGRVIDSRNRENTSSASDITVVPYKAPQVLYINSQRCTSDGTLADDGTYIKTTVKYRYWRVGDDNSMSYVRIRCKDRTASSWDPVENPWFSGFVTDNTETKADYKTVDAHKVYGNGDVDVDITYDVQFNIVDDVGESASANDIISTEYVLLDFNKSGKGIAVGKVSSSDKFDVAMDSSFDGYVSIPKLKLIELTNIDDIEQFGTSVEFTLHHGYFRSTASGTHPFSDGFIDTYVWRNHLTSTSIPFIRQVAYEDEKDTIKSRYYIGGSSQWSAWVTVVS